MIAIIDCGSKKTPEIVKKTSAYRAEVFSLDADLQNAVSQAEKIIISGAPILLSKTAAQYIGVFAFLKEIRVPVLGICFGHQVLGLVHGSSVFLGDPVRTPEKIQISHDPIFEGLDSETIFIQDHTEGITLPADFLSIGTSSTYEVQAMKHKYKPMYGVQFHPEVSGEAGETLFRNFLRL